MNEKLHEKLKMAGMVLHWLGKHDEANAIMQLAKWLHLNDVDTLAQLDDLLESANDNPNLRPLHD